MMSDRDKRKKKKFHRAAELRRDIVFTSSTEEDIGFPGFSNDGQHEKALSCHECGLVSGTDKATYAIANVQHMMNLGMRWHCNSCLKSPPEAKSLKQELNEFKAAMKMELMNVKDTFNSQLQCLQAVKLSKSDGKTQSHRPPLKPALPIRNKVTHQLIVAMDRNNPFTPATFAEKVKSNLSKVPIQKIQVDKGGNGIINFPD